MPVPAEWRWAALRDKDGDQLELQYRHTLEALARAPGLLGTIFRKAQNKIQDPAKLRRLVVMIDGETWIGLDVDVKGEIYEGLLERNAQEVKSGAGQYFTPRPLIRAMVEVMDPRPGETLDPACGTGGFLLAAYEHMKARRREIVEALRRLREETFTGIDIVDGVVRLCAMNLYLHGIGGEVSPVDQGDALISSRRRRFDIVLTNPPFGKKSSLHGGRRGWRHRAQVPGLRARRLHRHDLEQAAEFSPARHVDPQDPRIGGGGAAGQRPVRGRRRREGAAPAPARVRLPHAAAPADRHLLSPGRQGECPVLRQAAGERDALDQAPLDLRLPHQPELHAEAAAARREDLDDFVACYRPANRHARKESERFRGFAYDELIARDKANLDIFWLKDDSLEDADSLPAPWCSPPRSSRTWKPRSSSSGRWRRHCRSRLP